MRKILVTGGCGFIGCNFTRHLLKTHADYAVVNLDKLTYAGNLDSIADFADDPRHRFVQADICEESTVDSLVAECDMVVNFAAESHVDRSIMGGAEFIQTNVYGTYVLLEASRLHGIERFLQISTDEVYGTLESGLWTESSPLEPRSPYSASKASAELMTQAFHVTHGLPTVITRASNNIGPFQYPEKRVPLFITNAMDDLPIPVYGDGMQIRDHLHVDDHCAAIDLVLHSGVEGEAYNVGGENEATGIDVTRTILKHLEKPESLIEYVKDRAGHDQRYALDSSKIGELGWKPSFDVDTAMARTIDWYVDNEDWWRKIKSGDDYQSYYKRQYVQR